MTKQKRDENNRIPRVTKTCRVVLDGPDQRLPIGEFTLTEPEPGPKLEQFADMAFKSARSSLARLMVPIYKLTVIDGDTEESYGLQRWIKLVDGEEEAKRRYEGKGGKMTIHRRA